MGTTGYIYTSDDYGDDHVTAYDNGASAVQEALINGQVDCVVIDSAPALRLCCRQRRSDHSGHQYVTESYAIGVNKRQHRIARRLNQALAELTADGTVQSISLTKYISAE